TPRSMAPIATPHTRTARSSSGASTTAPPGPPEPGARWRAGPGRGDRRRGRCHSRLTPAQLVERGRDAWVDDPDEAMQRRRRNRRRALLTRDHWRIPPAGRDDLMRRVLTER